MPSSPERRSALGRVGGQDAGRDDGPPTVADDDVTHGTSAALAPTFKVAVVARRLGVAPATLRTWARRYGLGPSAHTAGAHRQYSSADLERLMAMRRLTLDGVAPAEAARIALATPVGARAAEPSTPLVLPHLADQGGTDAVRLAPRVRVAGAAHIGRDVDDLCAAVDAQDADVCTDLVDAALARVGVLPCWEHLVLPVLRLEHARADRGRALTDGIAMLGDCVLGSLGRAVRVVGGPPKVVLASAEGEDHALGLHVVAAALWERGTASLTMGPRVPREAVAAAARRVGPAVTAVLAVQPVRDPHQLHGLPGVHPPMSVVAFGPGWRRVELPTTVHAAPQVRHVLEDVLAAS